jgi:hydroxyacylglutathione hydrolase
MKLQEDLYAYPWKDPYENNCNTYVINGEKMVFIDPGHTRHLKKVFHQMEEDGLSPEKIALVIVTHSHPDHMEGVEAFLDKPVRIAMGRKKSATFWRAGKFSLI